MRNFGLTNYFMVISTFGVTGWYSELFKPLMPDWLAVGVFILPVLIVVFIHWGELPSRYVARAHLFAASMFMLMSLGMELGRFFDYRPEGELFFKILAHLGWVGAWGAIYRRSRRFQKSGARSNFP